MGCVPSDSLFELVAEECELEVLLWGQGADAGVLDAPETLHSHVVAEFDV